MGGGQSNTTASRATATELLPQLLIILSASMAPASWRTYGRALYVLVDFLGQFGFTKTLPLLPIIIAIFVTHLHKCNAASTVLTYLSAVSFLHKLYSMPDPVHTFIVQKAIAGVQRLKPKFDLRLPISLSVLHRITAALGKCPLTSYQRTMYKSMFLLAFAAFFTRW